MLSKVRYENGAAYITLEDCLLCQETNVNVVAEDGHAVTFEINE